MAQQQKILMYISPLFAFFSLNFPLGLILYWVTTNLWTLGQQHWFYSRNPMPQFDAKGNVMDPEPKPSLLEQDPQDQPRRSPHAAARRRSRRSSGSSRPASPAASAPAARSPAVEGRRRGRT